MPLLKHNKKIQHPYPCGQNLSANILQFIYFYNAIDLYKAY